MYERDMDMDMYERVVVKCWLLGFVVKDIVFTVILTMMTAYMTVY